MENWDEVRTAFQVARCGTVSGAAEVLGVHHATVIRHIDALEGRLGVKLFQRHGRGYTATEAGTDLLRVAQATEDQFGQLVNRIKGGSTEVSGDLVVTSLAENAPRIAPLLVAFQAQHPDVVVQYLTGERLFRLEYGEAHVAIRAGTAPPDQPDNVVQPFLSAAVGLYAAPSYLADHGVPVPASGFAGHRFVGPQDVDSRAPCYTWLAANVPRAQVTFRSDDPSARALAVIEGAGIGFLDIEQAADGTVVQVAPPDPAWSSPLWLVTHVDLHRTSKVQALLGFLKTYAKQAQTP